MPKLLNGSKEGIRTRALSIVSRHSTADRQTDKQNRLKFMRIMTTMSHRWFALNPLWLQWISSQQVLLHLQSQSDSRDYPGHHPERSHMIHQQAFES